MTSANPNAGPAGVRGVVSGGGGDGQVSSIVSLCLQRARARNPVAVIPARVAPNAAEFDMAELISWASRQAGLQPWLPAQPERLLTYCRQVGTTIAVSQACAVRGALLFYAGHVALSLGDNSRVLESPHPATGVIVGVCTGRSWSDAALIPRARGYR